MNNHPQQGLGDFLYRCAELASSAECAMTSTIYDHRLPFDTAPHPEQSEHAMAGKFELYKDTAGKHRFRLKASNGQIIASGEAYESRASALKASSRHTQERTRRCSTTRQPEAQPLLHIRSGASA